ncbi:MAG TPA: sigma-70 family RNA polymerase sigma factor [Polyangiaceae bacterium]|nr:sigma-70 family RNA polymerase sigma factor [Polyangiaceae bacterium]
MRAPFRKIFEDHVMQVTRTLRYLGIAEADLTDAAQEVFVVVDRRFGDFEGRSSLSSWIHGICLRVAMNYRKRMRRRREDVVAEPPESSVDADQHARLERHEERWLLTAVLDVLDDEHREIIVLHEIEKLPMREVAEVVGCALQTAYTRRRNALDKMRDELKRRRRYDGQG